MSYIVQLFFKNTNNSGEIYLEDDLQQKNPVINSLKIYREDFSEVF